MVVCTYLVDLLCLSDFFLFSFNFNSFLSFPEELMVFLLSSSIILDRCLYMNKTGSLVRMRINFSEILKNFSRIRWSFSKISTFYEGGIAMDKIEILDRLMEFCGMKNVRK